MSSLSPDYKALKKLMCSVEASLVLVVSSFKDSLAPATETISGLGCCEALLSLNPGSGPLRVGTGILSLSELFLGSRQHETESCLI